MDGIFGWLGDHGAHQELIRHMAGAGCLSPESLLHAHSSQLLGVAACSRFGKADIHVENGLAAALMGRPHFTDDELAFIARDRSPVVAIAHGWMRHGDHLPTLMRGNFAFAVLEPIKKRACLVLDRVGAERLCFAHRGGQLVFGSSVQQVAAHPAAGRNIDPQAIYDYLYFHTIPAPRSLYQGVHKLLPGQIVTLKNGQLDTRFYWQADYAPADAGFDQQRTNFRGLLDQAVHETDAPATAAFLSGGTDSSTVVGALTAVRGGPVDTFSIGFDADGFDEMEYARCAAERYGCRAHEYYLKPADIVTAVPLIAREYDEPFGNNSAVPTYFCARAAREAGFERMLAGDGGDEIFGGNERYRKDQIFGRFHRAPAPLRALARAIAHLLGGFESRLGNRVRNFVHRASLPNPDRFYSDDAFASKHFDALLGPALRGAVQRDDALDVQRRIYAQAQAGAELHRLMYLDMKMTIADNDLVKVTRAAKTSGVEVAFPYLDRRLVDFTGHLPASDKVRRLNKRHLFKLAMDDILPEAIRRKKKQGFGLPVSVWLQRGGAYADLVTDLVLSDRAAARGYVDPEFVRQLIDRHRRGLWDHAADIHMLAMLELWHREYVDPLVDHADAAPTRADAAAVAA